MNKILISLLFFIFFVSSVYSQPSIMIQDLNGEILDILSSGGITITFTNEVSSVDAGSANPRIITDPDNNRIDVNSDGSLTITFNEP